MKNFEPKVALSFTDEEIQRMDASLNPIETPVAYTLPEAGITVRLPSRNEMRVLRVQDQMVLNVVDANKWEKPIYFVTSVSDDVLMGLGPYLKLEGMVYRVMPKVVQESERIDIGRSIELLTNVYRYTNLENGKASLNETSSSLLTNYEASFIQLALAMRTPIAMLKRDIDMIGAAGDTTEVTKTLVAEKKKAYQDTLNLAIKMLDKCKRIVPLDWRPRVLLHEMLVENGMMKEAQINMKESIGIDPANEEYKRRLAEITMNNPVPQVLPQPLQQTEKVDSLKK